MFANTIEHVGAYTRQVKILIRKYQSEILERSTATLFFVNDEGYALTCGHIAQVLSAAEETNKRFKSFKDHIASLSHEKRTNEEIMKAERAYHIEKGMPIQIISQFPDCVDAAEGIQYIISTEFDLALIKFNGFKKKLYQGSAVFAKHSMLLRPGHMLCRLGYPFSDFADYKYDKCTDSIMWTGKGEDTSRFPIDGMLTRLINGEKKDAIFIELSTSGFVGHNGGPLFSPDGIVYGMQFETGHYPLGFDINDAHLCINGNDIEINNKPFMCVGHCIHVESIKKFLDENNVKYCIGDDLEQEEIIN